MKIGTLDRRVTIESATTTQDASGQPVETWTTFATVWAARKDVRGRERFDAAQRLAVRTAVYRIRWIAGLSEKMRIVDAGATYDVTGIAEDYRQGWAELSAEVVNPAAVQ